MRTLSATAAESPAISRTRSATMSGTASKVGTLLVQGPHRKGIVTSVSQVLSSHGATILDSNHYSDAGAKLFFQRLQFDVSTLSTDRVTLEKEFREICERAGMTWRVWYADRAKRVAILTSKQDHCLYDLLIRHRNKELHCLPVTKETKERQEASAAELIDRAGVDLIVLARYMQIMSPQFVSRYPARIINIHHSFLPAFVGGNAYRQAHEKGVKMIGATSHYVTSDLDQGPIIEQSTVRCAHRDSVDDLTRKGRDLEKQVLAAAVRWHLEDRVLVYNGKTVVFD
jgi:formyltetrahydrofolate deformylase